MTDIGEYATTDLYLASYLKAAGCTFRDTDRRNSKRVRFVFSNVPDERLTEWSRGTAMVNAVAYAAAVRDLKRALWNEEDNYSADK